jgi:outer membrane receptor protein involved in Fe transport
MRVTPSRRAWQRWLRLLGAALPLALYAPRALADDVADEADVQFNLGAEEYQAGHHERALAHFLASNRLVDNKNVLFNIARCYEQLRRFPEAHRYYERALAAESAPEAAAGIRRALERIAGRVALLQITTDPPGASIYLDRKDLGERGASPRTMALPPRTYRVIAALEGYRDATSEPVTLRIGSERAVTLQLERIVGRVSVVGAPGSSVRLDADNTPELCSTPCSVVTTPGQHVLILGRSGARPSRVPVSVIADQSTSIDADRVLDAGSLLIRTDEPGAVIEVDGVARGVTPAQLSLPVGQHRLSVRLTGFRPVERDVLIAANQELRLDLSLSAAESVEAASRLSEPVEQAPASVSLISGQELRAMRYPTLAEALRGTRGVFSSDDRGYPALGFRGFGRLGSYGNRVLVTLDGAPMNDDWIWSSYVGFDQRADLEDIERIEIVRGPGSALYGTSAFSGVVNLVTRTDGVPTSREVGVSAAADGVARARARFTQRFGEQGMVWASLAAGQSQGRDFFFPEYVADGPPEVAGVARDIDHARFVTFTGRARYRNLSLSWSLNHHDKQLPTGQFETLFGDGRTRQADTRGFADARLELPLGGFVTSVTRVHGNFYAYRGDFARSPGEGGLERNVYDSAWAGAEQRFVIAANDSLGLNVGAEGQLHPSIEQSGSTELGGPYFDDRQEFTVGAVYGTVDVRPMRAVKLSAGGRFDYYSTFGGSFNPRLALIIEPRDGTNIKLIGAKAFKAPSVYERTYAFIGQDPNPQLQPENIYSAELELSQRFENHVVATVAAYANYIADLISLESARDGSDDVQFQNTGTPVGTLGAELEVRRDFRAGWMLVATYSLQRSTYLASKGLGALIDQERSPVLREVPNSPHHLASLKAALPLLGPELSLMQRLTFEGQRYDTEDDASSPTPQTRTDASLSWDVVLSGKEQRFGLDYALGVYNAFDSRPHNPVSSEFRQRSIPILGRSFLAAMGLTF